MNSVIKSLTLRNNLRINKNRLKYPRIRQCKLKMNLNNYKMRLRSIKINGNIK